MNPGETQAEDPPVKPGGEFVVLATVYMTVYLVHLTEAWQFPFAATFFIGLALLMVLRGISAWSFYLFIALASAYTLVFQIPDVPNHENIYLLCNLFLIVGLLDHLFRRPRATGRSRAFIHERDLIRMIKPTLRVTLSVVYILAGFHKLNWDFFHYESGCGVRFFRRVAEKFGLGGVDWPGLVLSTVPVFVLAWELAGGILLWFRRFQLPVLVLAWSIHALLAQLVIMDFSSLAFALMLSFVPSAQFDLIANAPLRAGGLRLHRASFYLLINAAVAVFAGVYSLLHGFEPWLHRWQGLGLNVGFLVVVWPVVADRFRARGTAWQGVPVWRPRFPWWRSLLVVCLILYGLTPYLGLRTTGNFTMFSNLRTEGRSNHLLLGSNPLKLWGYQEDVVEIIDIEPRHEVGLRESLKGHLIPVVEFKKMIYDWRTQAFENLSAVYSYEGRVYETGDLANDNPWNVTGRDLEMYLLDFRVVQKGPEPTACRW